MNKINFSLLLAGSVIVPMICGCNGNQAYADRISPMVIPSAGTAGQVVVTPQAIPGTVRANNHNVTGGYAPSNVQAQLKINVSDGTKVVNVIRDTADPFVITKPYVLKNADPYAVRSYLEAAVGAKSINASPAQVTAVKFSDGAGVVLVSAEQYRFADSEDGKGIDGIVASLDRPGLNYLPEADAYIYFPRISRASNLRDMLLNVGSSALDPQFEVAPGTITVDAELNALVIKASKWNWADMRNMLKQYDRPIPEFKITYRVLEIYAENDDRIGVDFQSWKNNEGVDLFSAGMVNRRNWGTFFSSAIEGNGSSRTSYWNFNPKWNTRYLDFMTSIGKAKCVASGTLVARNRMPSHIQVNSGFFYDRTSYNAGATTLAEACTEFVYADVNPDTIQREAVTKIMTLQGLTDFYNEAGAAVLAWTPIGYAMRMMNTQTGGFAYGDATQVALPQLEASKAQLQAAITSYKQAAAQAAAAGDAVAAATANATAAAYQAKLNELNSLNTSGDLSKFLTGYVKVNADGSTTPVQATWYNTNWDTHDALSGIIHGTLQYPMPQDGFKFDLVATPVVTGKAAKLDIALNSISLLGWNSDGSARKSSSNVSTTVQIGYDAKTFVIGGLKKSESVRSTAGLPFVKDLPVIGRVFSTESESIKQSQLVLIAEVQYVNADDAAGTDVRDHMGKIINNVNNGMTSRVGNMFFQQYGLDSDRADREKRLDDINNKVNDETKGYR